MMDWDEDIAALDLSDVEKDGLQVYRNYTLAFEGQAEKVFAKEADAEPFDILALERVLELVAIEDARFLPVIACAYSDDLLTSMFRAELPDSVPSGKSTLFGPHGPLSTLFNRLQLAAAFDMLSPDLISDLDRVRKARNDISHSWDISAFRNFFTEPQSSKLYPVDQVIAENIEELRSSMEDADPQKLFRVRLIWIMALLTYETAYYARAKRHRLSPHKALFGPNQPKSLSKVSGIALNATKKVISG